MRKINKYKKFVAAFLLVVMVSELIIPLPAFALTSGPGQPEAQRFQPANTSDMVDLFSGDMSYNIPLMDVGGYPVNLAYQSGSGMDDEASWVGFGWTLNPGAVNRDVRGLPDDFNGDLVTKEFNKKPLIKIGADLKLKPTIFGFNRNKNVGLKIGVFRDNYYGVGALVGVNAGFNMTQAIAGPLSGGLGLGVELETSSRDGVTISPNLNFSITGKLDRINDLKLGGSLGATYNSREGLKLLELGSSFGAGNLKGNKNGQTLDVESSTIYTIGESHSPIIDMPMKTNGFTFDFDAGPIVFGPYLGVGGSGFYTKSELDQSIVGQPAYGFLHSEKGKNDLDALMDFNRENDRPYFKGSPAIAIPVLTNDNFSVNNQEGSMQFRPFRSGSGIVFDHQAENKTTQNTVGLTVGAGALVQGGGSFYRMVAKTRTEKWNTRNHFKGVGDFHDYNSTTPSIEPVYFKQVGEKLRANDDYRGDIDEHARAVSVSFPGIPAAHTAMFDKNRGVKDYTNNPINRTERDKRGYTFSYMTAFEASRLGLDRRIRNHTNFNTLCITNNFFGLPRMSLYRRPHHISEITVTNTSGQRFVYGVPVYNVHQTEVTFSTDDKKKQLNNPNLYKELRDNGEATYTGTENSRSNSKGRDNYFSKETLPGYATSFLLSGILSPDYVDKTNNGISDDDLGTAVKFNYTKLPFLYQWRAPFGKSSASYANYNEGFLVDGKDDKLNYVYGQKEIWYLHSIESKTMVAIFETSDRKDGLGVNGSNGGMTTNPAHRLKRLDKIKLYSKAEVQKAGGVLNATPVKVVHFEYDYSICPGIENHEDKQPGQNVHGKLTLKKVWFTFGKNSRGELHPYEFEYQDANTTYQKRAIDRWGNYKPRNLNPTYTDAELAGTPNLNNSEWPYALQNGTANTLAGVWQLNEIITPSKGKIKITYESDDYSFVQNKPVMQMFTLNGLGTTGSNTGLIEKDLILVNLPEPTTTAEFKEKYLKGIKYLYYKFYVQLTNDTKTYEYVPGYAEIELNGCTASGTVGTIKVKKIGGINPMSKNTWQFLRLSLPQIAYPGYDNSELAGSDFRKLIKSLKDAIANLGELTTPFDEKANDKDFANTIRLDRSWIRLLSPKGWKYGGGCRVKRIETNDGWPAMSSTPTAPAGVYGQDYIYKTTRQRDGGQVEEISSGVAAYEPLVGGDENPFRQPVTFKQDVILGLDNYHYIEEPICESYYPAPTVGYSHVKVTSFGKELPESPTQSETTGYSVSEFFTARDFPTIVEKVPLDPKFIKPSPVLRLLGAEVTDRVVVTQGYKVELNDMHGKPKKDQLFNKGGDLVSMVEYFFKTENPDAEFKRLNNTVSTIGPNGQIDDDAVLGVDVEMFTDMRQQETRNEGRMIGAYGGAVNWGIFPWPFAKVNLAFNKQHTSYNSSSTIKLVQKYGILEKVRKTNDGSTLTTENMLWDEETGDVLLNKTENEFEDPVYSFTYPVHWAYAGMGPAYKNEGLVLQTFSTISGIPGRINTTYNNLLHPGDEVSTPLSMRRFWVTAKAPDGFMYLIDAAGNLVNLSNTSVKVYRSGRRNLSSTGMGTIVMLKNPIQGNQLVIAQENHILDAKMTTYKDEWAVPINSRVGMETEASACPDMNFVKYFLYSGMVHRYSGGRRALFSMERDNQNIGNLVYDAYSERIDGPHLDNLTLNNGLNNFLYFEPAYSYGFYWNTIHRSFVIPGFRYRYTLQVGDQGRIGDGTITVNCVTPEFNDLVNENYTTTEMKNLLDSAYCMQGTLSAEGCVFKLVKKGLPDDGPCANPGGGSSIASQEQQVPCSGKVILVFTISVPPGTKEACLEPLNQHINPFFTGISGNWRSHQQWAHTVNRVSLTSDNSINGSTDIRRSGYYKLYTNFWEYDGAIFKRSSLSSVDLWWVRGTEITGYNNKTQELETKNALDHFGTAQYGFLETLPLAVASNAQYREIAYDGFEDYNFKFSCGNLACAPTGHFNFKQQILAPFTTDVFCNSVGCLSTAKAHTGKYSLQLNTPITVTRQISSVDGIQSSVLGRHADGRYILTGNEISKGFAPDPGSQYVMSFWVHEGNNPSSASPEVTVSINGSQNLLDGVKCPVVEDWKRVWIVFTQEQNLSNFTFTIDPNGGSKYIDDIRIFPFKGHVKTFAYDERNLRVMAEMDENNLATFYEYDDEGLLIRVKKETERGIVTLKENRSALGKRQP